MINQSRFVDNVPLLLLIVLCVMLIVIGVIMAFSTPVTWPITPGSLKARKVLIDGSPYAEIEGEPMNYLGQCQIVDISQPSGTKQILVRRFLIRWNPFMRGNVSFQWPQFFSLEGLEPGDYSVVYESSDGLKQAGNVSVESSVR